MEQPTSQPNDRYFELIKDMLEEDEYMVLLVKQSRLWPGVPLNSVFKPSIFFLTNERLIILSRHNLGIKMNVTVIPLNTIRSIRLERGLFLSSVVTGQMGSAMRSNTSSPRSMDGLSHDSARKLMERLSKEIREMNRVVLSKHQTEHILQSKLALCKFCGSSLTHNAKFCANCGNKV